MFPFMELVQEAESIIIAGHIHPDGDCVGSCLAMYNYLKKIAGQEKVIDVFLEEVPRSFAFLTGSDRVKFFPECTRNYDLFIAIDSGSIDRLGPLEATFAAAKHTICLDHHVSNTNYAEYNHVEPTASSAGEVLTGLFDLSVVDHEIAECLYLAIVHDTGVFKHSNTSQRTMEFAGALLSKGVSSSKIIDDSFYKKTYIQSQLLGRCLVESVLLMDGKIIFSAVSQKILKFYGAVMSDLDGVIDQLRVIEGVEVAILLKEESAQKYKVSMRSNGKVNVSKICCLFGGGGHIMAAGCTMCGSVHDVVNNISVQIAEQLQQTENSENN